MELIEAVWLEFDGLGVQAKINGLENMWHVKFLLTLEIEKENDFQYTDCQ